MFLGGCHKMTPRQVGNRVTLTTSDQCFVQVCGVKQSWSALCEDTRVLVQVISSAIRALLPLHVSCWAAKPPKPTSPGLPKSPASSMLVFYSGIQEKTLTTAAVAVAVGSANGGEGQHCRFSCLPRLDLQWGETRVSPQEVRFRR